jgi:predicted transposase YbfD/YdcC
LPITVLAARSGPQSDDADAAGEDLAGRDLLVALARVPDPRKARGVRHRLVTVLAAAVCAVLAGARSYVAIAEWTRDLPVGVRLRLGLGRCAPSESTIRRILQAVDAQALDTVVSDWLAHRVASSTASCPASAVVKPSEARSSPARAVAVDGKAARGDNGRPAHLFAAFDHRSGVVLGQSEVDGKTNEITAFAPLLDRLDLADVVITADALCRCLIWGDLGPVC